MTALTPELIGLPAFLIFLGFSTFLTALLRGWIVLGREYRTMAADRDYWRSRAERSTSLAERGVAVAESLVGGPP